MRNLWFRIRYILYCNMFYIHILLMLLIIFIADSIVDPNTIEIIGNHDSDKHGFMISAGVYVGIPMVISAILLLIFNRFRKWAMDTCYYNKEGAVGLLIILTIVTTLIYSACKYNGSLLAFKLIYYIMPEVILGFRYLAEDE